MLQLLRMKKFFVYLFFLLGYSVTAIFWWHFSGSMFTEGDNALRLLIVGRLAGLLATITALHQLLLIGRIKWIESVYGLDRLSRVHKWNGYLAILLMIIHVVLVTKAYSILNSVSYATQYISFLTKYEDIVSAFFAIVILTVTVGLSITIVRRNLKYEWWYYVHILNYLTFFLFASHQLEYGMSQNSDWFKLYWVAIYMFTAAHIGYFRFVKPIFNYWRHGFKISKVVSENDVATSIYITGHDIEKFKRQSGQFMIFRFLQTGFWTQQHPFSLSWGANNKELRITAKKLGDFTSMMPKLTVGTPVLIDGPHGVFTAEQIKRDKVLMIAGGIGVTPLGSLSEELAGHTDIVFIYSAKSQKEAVLLDEIKQIEQKSNQAFKLIEIYSEQQVPQAEHGMLNKDTLIRLVPDLASRDVFLCGPPAMMNALKSSLIELGLPKKQLHWERFAL